VLKARSYGHIKGAKNEAHGVDQEQFFRGFGAHRGSIAERFEGQCHVVRAAYHTLSGERVSAGCKVTEGMRRRVRVKAVVSYMPGNFQQTAVDT
jgi:hypothetical protein